MAQRRSLRLKRLTLPPAINSLANETLLHIFSFLAGPTAYSSKHSLCQASLVSKRWCELAQQVLYQDLAAMGFAFPPLKNEYSYKYCLANWRDCEQLLKRRGHGWEDDSDGVSLANLERTLRSRPDFGKLVRTAVLLFPTMRGYMNTTDLRPFFPRLRELFACVQSYDLQELAELPNLEVLHLDDCKLQSPPSRFSATNPSHRRPQFPSLEDFKVHESKFDMTSPLEMVLKSIPVGQLKRLEVWRNDNVERASAVSSSVGNKDNKEEGPLLSSLTPHLPFLDLFHYYPADESTELDDIINLLHLATNLTTLAISITDLTTQLPITIRDMPSTLQKLYLNFLVDIDTPDCIFRIGDGQSFAAALSDRLRLDDEKGLPYLHYLEVENGLGFPENEEEGEDVEEIIKSRECRKGMIEHCTRLIEELDRRNIGYRSI